MAKAYYKCPVCGKDIKVEACNSASARSKAAWMESKGIKCFDCQKAEENEKAKAFSAGRDLAELIGTPKQVAWATTIRAEAISRAEAIGNADRVAWISGLTSASYIIDFRGDLDRCHMLHVALVKASAIWTTFDERKQVEFLGECLLRFSEKLCKGDALYEELRNGRNVYEMIRAFKANDTEEGRAALEAENAVKAIEKALKDAYDATGRQGREKPYDGEEAKLDGTPKQAEYAGYLRMRMICTVSEKAGAFLAKIRASKWWLDEKSEKDNRYACIPVVTDTAAMAELIAAAEAAVAKISSETPESKGIASRLNAVRKSMAEIMEMHRKALQAMRDTSIKLRTGADRIAYTTEKYLRISVDGGWDIIVPTAIIRKIDGTNDIALLIPRQEYQFWASKKADEGYDEETWSVDQVIAHGVAVMTEDAPLSEMPAWKPKPTANDRGLEVIRHTPEHLDPVETEVPDELLR